MSGHIQAGELRERLAVWKAGAVTDPGGETDYAYSRLRTIWAHVMPVSGRTAELPGEAERAEVTHKVRLPSAQARCRKSAARCILWCADSGLMFCIGIPCTTGAAGLKSSAEWCRGRCLPVAREGFDIHELDEFTDRLIQFPRRQRRRA